MNEQAITVDKLSKKFILPHQKKSTLKSFIVNPFVRYEKESQVAFEGVSFSVKKGEFFGVVGRNGSGKSTLLKCIAGVYSSDKGSININGTLVPFIELGVGFNPELTGRDNVYLNGSLLGLNRASIEKMYEEIVEFAELERFMDQKLKNYSSGMQVRLAFSIAIRAESDILLLDEVLAVGDAAFQQKCYDYFNSLKNANRTIVLVSHNMQIIDQFCDRALLLDKGRVKHIGTSAEVSSMYEEMFLHEEAEQKTKKIPTTKTGQLDNTLDPLKIHSVDVLQGGKKIKYLKANRDFEVHIDIEAKETLKEANVGINIKNRDKQMLIFTDTWVEMGSISLLRNERKRVVFKIENNLTNGLYTINLGIADTSKKIHKVIMRKESIHIFTVEGIKNHVQALTHPHIKASVKNISD